MENVLQAINAKCVALADAEIKTNNVILREVIDRIIAELKKDNLFKVLYKGNFYGGSFYDGLKVGNSTEFDIDMLLVLPKLLKPNVEASDKPGFVHVVVPEDLLVDEKYKVLKNFIESSTNRISAKKVSSWIESLIKKSLDSLCPNGTPLSEKHVNGKLYKIFVKDRKSGPAFTFLITAKAPGDQVLMDVDLVPCFQFTSSLWPLKSKHYRAFDKSKHEKDTFLAVPKLPTDCKNPDFYWRLSFQEQERFLISGDDKNRLKPALRLLKKIRDHYDHKKISSYYIKTVFLWQVERQSKDFWNKPLKEVFIEMLKIYEQHLSQRSIKYYWNSKYDFISSVNPSTLEGFANKIKRIIQDCERYSDSDPIKIAIHMVPAEDVEQLRKEITLPKKLSSPPPCNNNCRGIIEKLRLENETLHERIQHLENELRTLKARDNSNNNVGNSFGLLHQLMGGLSLSRNAANSSTL